MSLNIICKACNTVIEQIESLDGVDIPVKCPHCGMGRVAVEKAIPQDISSIVFDLWITNKNTAATKHEGILLTTEEIHGKSEKEIESLFIEKTATAVAGLLKQENIGTLLRRD